MTQPTRSETTVSMEKGAFLVENNVAGNKKPLGNEGHFVDFSARELAGKPSPDGRTLRT